MSTRSDFSKTAHLEKRRKLILDRAYKMIVKNGIAKTTMKDIAIECEIGRKTLYRFFSSIEEIANVIIKNIATSPESFAMTYEPKGSNGYEKLESSIKQWYNFCIQHKDYMFFYYEYDHYFREPKEKKMHDFWKKKPNMFRDYLSEGIKDGSLNLKESQVETLGMTIPLSIVSTVQRVILREDVYKYENNYGLENINELVDLLVMGLKK